MDSRKNMVLLPRMACLSAIAILLSGCSAFWSFPWPHETENTEGLGTTPIGNCLREKWRHSFDIKLEVTEFIKARTSAKGISRGDAEALGMQCAPSTECIYSGEVWSQIDRGLSPDSPHYGMRTIEHFEVRFSYRKPHQIVVKQDDHDVPAE